MADERTIFDKPHFQSLELLAARALSEGNVATAFKLADRRCRILPLPEPHCYVLRAEAHFRMGAKSAAIADIVKALEIAPDDLLANRRMLAWTAQPQQKVQAASALLKSETKLEFLRKVVAALRANRQRSFARVNVSPDTVEGWAVWQDDAPLTVSVANGPTNVSAIVEPDAAHPLAEFGRAAGFTVKRPKSTDSQFIELSAAGKVLYSARTAGNEARPKAETIRTQVADARSVTVIVPVYRDFLATRRCLDSLFDNINARRHRVILVDDESPEPRIKKYLSGLGTRRGVEILINARNLGYAGSINRALERSGNDDVVLLNADAVVPSGFIDRLAAVAHASSDIGTVTPLSNNGEFTSFPIPFVANPLPPLRKIRRIDEIAAEANLNKIIDIPSGVGFCLYVTRTCLDAVGPLSEEFGPGYLEDADFCLRARNHGFRSVCAASVFVGHAGSKSFGREKRSLVVRNLRVLEQRFPNHRFECATFMADDPLRIAREAIERVYVAVPNHPRLLITGTGAVGDVARERARNLPSKAGPVIILEISHAVDGVSARLIGSDGGVPQSLEFKLADSKEFEVLSALLRRVHPSRIEFFDPAGIPLQLVESLLRLRTKYDIFVADAGLLGAQSEQFLAAVPRSLGSEEKSSALQSSAGPELGNWLDRWRNIAAGARRILAPCPHAKAFATSVFPGRKIDEMWHSRKSRSRPRYKIVKSPIRQLGLVPVRRCAQEQWLIGEVANKLSKMRPEVLITVIGATLDDIELMRRGNVFVTGTVNADEFESLIQSLGLDHLFITVTRPLFAHPVLGAAESSLLPTAYFDWSKGRVKPKKMDLSIDPAISLDGIVGALDRWIAVRPDNSQEI